jgi:chemotaxis signal transduction protein
VISSSDSSYKPGQAFDLPIDLSGIKPGESKSYLVEFEGEHFAVGVTLSHGYREYKSESDSYQNDVYGVVISSLGKAVTKSKGQKLEVKVRLDYGPKPVGTVTREFATFYIAGAWLGVDKEKVLECVDLGAVTPVPGLPKAVLGTILYKGDPIFVVEAHDLLGNTADLSRTKGDQVVVMKVGDEPVGLRVDELGEIPEVPESYIISAGQWSGVRSQAVEAMVKPAPNDPLKRILVVLSPEKFLEFTLGNQGIDVVKNMAASVHLQAEQSKEPALKPTG